MTAIAYKSAQRTTYSGVEQVLETSEKDGIKCVWCGSVSGNLVEYSWEFDWNELRNQGINHITGNITVSSPPNYYIPQTMTVDIGENCDLVTNNFNMNSIYQYCSGLFEYSLTSHYGSPEKISYDEMFAPSEINDVVLVIEGKKLHVNKAFLSIHSEFFRALFSANFKEGQMNEIPIEEVSYEDFGLLMSSFYPNPVFPNDQTAEKLLELADRFLISSVIGIVEYHLIFNSRISEEKILWLADKYVMEKRLVKSIRQINTLKKVKNLKNSSHFVELTDSTRSRILARLMDLI